MKTKIILVALFAVCLYSCGHNKEYGEKELNTANMVRAKDAVANSDYGEAKYYLDKELEENPKNGYAYMVQAFLYGEIEEYEKSITASDMALKYIPKKDKKNRSVAFGCRARSNANVGNYDEAVKDYSSAIKKDKKNVDLYFKRGDVYYWLGEYERSNKDFFKCVKLEPNYYFAYMGLGRNCAEIDLYDKAIYYFNKAIELGPDDYSSGYSFRAECYFKLGNYRRAANDIVTALDIDHDSKAWNLMYAVADSSYSDMEGRLLAEVGRDKSDDYWPYCLGVIAEKAERLTSAIMHYKCALNNAKGSEAEGIFLDRLANCTCKLGDYRNALDYANRAVEADVEEREYRDTRIGILFELDDYNGLMKDIEYCLETNPNCSGYYYAKRGWYEMFYKQYNAALSDYSAAIAMRDDVAGYYLYRGRLLLMKNDVKQAKKDFKKAISLDTSDMSTMSDAVFAYHFLGDDKNALRLLDTTLSYGDNYYNAACLFSLMGDKEKAIEYLRKELENGWNRFNHINRDPDLDNIRDDEAFKQLVNEYKTRRHSFEDTPTVKQIENTATKKINVSIPFKHKNGVNEVKCKINGLPLYFIFDTGASDVTISSVEAAFMLKNGYLSSADIKGRSSYRVASGEIVEGTIINLKKIELSDGLVLDNVKASVVKGQDAPLLLGQTVLSRLGKIEIDNQKQVIKVTY